MKRELTLKHLYPYLPYGLKIRDLKRPLDSKFGIEILSPSDLNQGIIDIWNKYGNRKPILRPISDLLAIKKGSATFLDIIEYRCNGYQIGSNLSRFNFDQLPYEVVKYLLEQHFDIFGLIDVGLAIDINTIYPS